VLGIRNEELMMKSTRKLVFMGLFISLEIILTRVVGLMPTNITRISLSFVVYTFSGLMFGPWFTAIMAFFGDIVGAMLFPPIGGFFIGFSISALVSGFLFGLISKDYKRIFLVLLLNLLIVEIGMNTFWLKIITHTPFWALLIKRIPGIMTNVLIRVVVLIPLLKKFEVSLLNENGY